MKINFNRLGDKDIKNKITNIFETALKMTQTKQNVSVNITIVGENAIRQLNNEYRNVDRVTDVLSFPLNEGEDFKSNEFCDNEICSDLGDIVICKKRVVSQASEYGHSFEREMCFLALHGLLHLLGYDHITQSEEKQMFGLSEEILKQNKIGR